MLTVPIQFWCGLPFLRGAWVRARARTTNMDTLIALATLTAFVYATVELLTAPNVHVHGGPGGEFNAHLHYDIPAVIIAFLCVGRWCEATARNRAGRAVRELTMLGAQQARLLDTADPAARRAARPGRGGAPRATCSWCVRATRFRSTASSCRAPRRSTSRC